MSLYIPVPIPSLWRRCQVPCVEKSVWRFLLPRQNASFPLHVALAWHFLKAEPSSIKPSSQENSSVFGNVVADPCTLPCSGKDSLPQSTAKVNTTQHNVNRAEVPHVVHCYVYAFFMCEYGVVKIMVHNVGDAYDLDTPSQEVSFPLQEPFARQTLIDDPLTTNPSSHWKYTLFGYVVSSP